MIGNSGGLINVMSFGWLKTDPSLPDCLTTPRVLTNFHILEFAQPKTIDANSSPLGKHYRVCKIFSQQNLTIIEG